MTDKKYEQMVCRDTYGETKMERKRYEPPRVKMFESGPDCESGGAESDYCAGGGRASFGCGAGGRFQG
ncbi:MAG: hypothetical protein ABIN17_07320 [candidate division WOR-3 bacterium]